MTHRFKVTGTSKVPVTLADLFDRNSLNKRTWRIQI